jgi:hypothetical protein
MPDEGKLGGAEFEERHGGMVELDALEALQPGEFARLHEEAFAPYRDDTLEDRLAEADEEAREAAAEQWEADIADEVAEAESLRHAVDEVMRRYREEIEDLQERIEADLQPYRQQMQDIVGRINEKAEEFDAALPERPVAEVDVDEDDDDWLLDLSRDYLDQLNAYRRFKGQDEIAWALAEPPESEPPQLPPELEPPRRRLMRLGHPSSPTSSTSTPRLIRRRPR